MRYKFPLNLDFGSEAHVTPHRKRSISLQAACVKGFFKKLFITQW